MMEWVLTGYYCTTRISTHRYNSYYTSTCKSVTLKLQKLQQVSEGHFQSFQRMPTRVVAIKLQLSYSQGSEFYPNTKEKKAVWPARLTLSVGQLIDLHITSTDCTIILIRGMCTVKHHKVQIQIFHLVHLSNYVFSSGDGYSVFIVIFLSVV